MNKYDLAYEHDQLVDVIHDYDQRIDELLDHITDLSINYDSLKVEVLVLYAICGLAGLTLLLVLAL